MLRPTPVTVPTPDEYLSLKNVELIRCRTYNRVLYVDMPKSASTSIKTALNKTGMDYYQSISWWHSLPWSWVDHHEIDFSFTFVRHPISRVISTYFMYLDIRPERAEGGFDCFIEKVLHDDDDVHYKPQYLMLPIKAGNVQLDFVGKFENIQEDWKNLQKQFSWFDDLPHMNESRILKVHLTDKQEAALAERYAEDLKLFNYSLRDYDEYLKQKGTP